MLNLLLKSTLTLFLFLCYVEGKSNFVETVVKTEVFTIKLEPFMFNWTFEGRRDQFVYEATLVDHPDLPSWMNYVFSDKHHSGFLYGVVPNHVRHRVTLDVVAWNKKTYETRIENIDIIIEEKLNPAIHEVHIKIDNLNVADMFEASRMQALMDIFRSQLWEDSGEDLYVTFLESAVNLGARRPLDPNQGDGLILKLGSGATFSSGLLALQQEVGPLYSIPNCPRDFIRTSVERVFRDRGFLVDWCKFLLVNTEQGQNKEQSKQLEVTPNLPKENRPKPSDNWESFFNREDVPERSYRKDLVMAIAVPLLIMMFLVVLLSFIICVVHDDLNDEASEFFFQNIFHICTDCYEERVGLSKELAESTLEEERSSMEPLDFNQRINTLRSLSEEREYSVPPSPDILLANRSPNSTVSRGVHCRPSPPPYVRPRYKPDAPQEQNSPISADNNRVEALENEDGNSWYC